MVSQAYEFGKEEILECLTVHRGVTTAAGAANGSTLIDSSLIGSNDFITRKTILITTGNAQWEMLTATAFNPANGQITVKTPYFSAQIARVTAYKVLNLELPGGELVSYRGTTTANGAPAGASLIDAGLAAFPDYDGNLVVITSGTYAGQARDINGSTLAGTVVPDTNFGGQIMAGTNFTIYATRGAAAGIAAILARIGDPTAHTLTSLTAKWGNIARSLDLIMGARWDAAGDLGTDITALLAAAVMGQGLAFYGVVTAVPGANQFTIPGLAGYGETAFVNWTAFVFWDAAGGGAAPQGESQAVTTYATATGIFQAGAFTAAVDVGDHILILHPRIAEIATILTAVVAIQARTDNLAGLAPDVGATVANWNSGVATSGNAGADVCTFGANDTRNKVNSAIVSMRNLTAAATITVRAYMQVNGVEDEVYNQAFTQGTDPDGIWWINGVVEIHEQVRVELHSTAGADDGATVPYDNSLEAM